MNSPHKWPVTRKMFPFDDVIMNNWWTEAKTHWIISTSFPRFISLYMDIQHTSLTFALTENIVDQWQKIHISSDIPWQTFPKHVSGNNPHVVQLMFIKMIRAKVQSVSVCWKMNVLLVNNTWAVSVSINLHTSGFYSDTRRELTAEMQNVTPLYEDSRPLLCLGAIHRDISHDTKTTSVKYKSDIFPTKDTPHLIIRDDKRVCLTWKF